MLYLLLQIKQKKHPTKLLKSNTIDWGWSLKWWSLPHMKKLKILFLWWGLPHTSFLCLFMLLFGLNFLQQPLQKNTCPHYCAAKALTRTWKPCQRQYRDETSVLSLFCFFTQHCTDPIQQQHEIPHKPALDICWSRWQYMGSSHELLEADPLSWRWYSKWQSWSFCMA